MAEAEAKDRLAEAMEKYGEAAMMSMVVERLPEIMAQIAKPMEQIDKITVIDNGSGDGGVKLVKLLVMLLLMGLKF
ncbi:MAG: flotillin domain-containing protein [Thomasclavelia ramosa]